ncbi:hypothetical protein DIPPA_30456 [Diplonema papillatum]|nr:hypothetical protein DIPPA_30456 [Diplonema papillatum]
MNDADPAANAEKHKRKRRRRSSRSLAERTTDGMLEGWAVGGEREQARQASGTAANAPKPRGGGSAKRGARDSDACNAAERLSSSGTRSSGNENTPANRPRRVPAASQQNPETGARAAAAGRGAAVSDRAPPSPGGASSEPEAPLLFCLDPRARPAGSRPHPQAAPSGHPPDQPHLPNDDVGEHCSTPLSPPFYIAAPVANVPCLSRPAYLNRLYAAVFHPVSKAPLHPRPRLGNGLGSPTVGGLSAAGVTGKPAPFAAAERSSAAVSETGRRERRAPSVGGGPKRCGTEAQARSGGLQEIPARPTDVFLESGIRDGSQESAREGGPGQPPDGEAAPCKVDLSAGAFDTSIFGLLPPAGTPEMPPASAANIADQSPAAVGGASTVNTVDQNPAAVVDQSPAAVGGASTVNTVDQNPAAVVDQSPAAVGGASTVNTVDQNPAAVVDQSPAVGEASATNIVDRSSAAIVDQSPAAVGKASAANTVDQSPAAAGEASAAVKAPALAAASPQPTPSCVARAPVAGERPAAPPASDDSNVANQFLPASAPPPVASEQPTPSAVTQGPTAGKVDRSHTASEQPTPDHEPAMHQRGHGQPSESEPGRILIIQSTSKTRRDAPSEAMQPERPTHVAPAANYEQGHQLSGWDTGCAPLRSQNLARNVHNPGSQHAAGPLSKQDRQGELARSHADRTATEKQAEEASREALWNRAEDREPRGWNCAQDAGEDGGWEFVTGSEADLQTSWWGQLSAHAGTLELSPPQALQRLVSAAAGGGVSASMLLQAASWTFLPAALRTEGGLQGTLRARSSRPPAEEEPRPSFLAGSQQHPHRTPPRSLFEPGYQELPRADDPPAAAAAAAAAGSPAALHPARSTGSVYQGVALVPLLPGSRTAFRPEAGASASKGGQQPAHGFQPGSAGCAGTQNPGENVRDSSVMMGISQGREPTGLPPAAAAAAAAVRPSREATAARPPPGGGGQGSALVPLVTGGRAAPQPEPGAPASKGGQQSAPGVQPGGGAARCEGAAGSSPAAAPLRPQQDAGALPAGNHRLPEHPGPRRPSARPQSVRAPPPAPVPVSTLVHPPRRRPSARSARTSHVQQTLLGQPASRSNHPHTHNHGHRHQNRSHSHQNHHQKHSHNQHHSHHQHHNHDHQQDSLARSLGHPAAGFPSPFLVETQQRMHSGDSGSEGNGDWCYPTTAVDPSLQRPASEDGASRPCCPATAIDPALQRPPSGSGASRNGDRCHQPTTAVDSSGGGASRSGHPCCPTTAIDPSLQRPPSGGSSMTRSGDRGYPTAAAQPSLRRPAGRRRSSGDNAGDAEVSPSLECGANAVGGGEACPPGAAAACPGGQRAPHQLGEEADGTGGSVEDAAPQQVDGAPSEGQDPSPQGGTSDTGDLRPASAASAKFAGRNSRQDAPSTAGDGEGGNACQHTTGRSTQPRPRDTSDTTGDLRPASAASAKLAGRNSRQDAPSTGCRHTAGRSSTQPRPQSAAAPRVVSRGESAGAAESPPLFPPPHPDGCAEYPYPVVPDETSEASSHHQDEEEEEEVESVVVPLSAGKRPAPSPLGLALRLEPKPPCSKGGQPAASVSESESAATAAATLVVECVDRSSSSGAARRETAGLSSAAAAAAAAAGGFNKRGRFVHSAPLTSRLQVLSLRRLVLGVSPSACRLRPTYVAYSLSRYK